MIPVLILAAGQSSRLRGRDKLLEDVGGEPLLRRHVRQALGLGGEVFVALAPGQDARVAAIADLSATVLEMPEASEGMSGTLRGAVARLPECRAFIVVLADLVAIEAKDLSAVHDAYEANPDHLIWRGATKDDRPGHPIIFAARLRPDFAELSGDGGGESLIKSLKSQTFLVTLDGDRARLDLDTPEEWAAWRNASR